MGMRGYRSNILMFADVGIDTKINNKIINKIIKDLYDQIFLKMFLSNLIIILNNNVKEFPLINQYQ